MSKLLDSLVLLTIIMVIAVVMATGCASEPRVEYVNRTQLVPIDLPDALLQECAITEPPDKEQYLLETCDGKEDVLTDYTIHLLTDLKTCNDQIAKLKGIRDQTMTIYHQRKEVKSE